MKLMRWLVECEKELHLSQTFGFHGKYLPKIFYTQNSYWRSLRRIKKEIVCVVCLGEVTLVSDMARNNFYLLLSILSLHVIYASDDVFRVKTGNFCSIFQKLKCHPCPTPPKQCCFILTPVTPVLDCYSILTLVGLI